MPKGGIRPRGSDGSLDHLIKPKWQSGETRTIRVPIILVDQVLEAAHKIDEGETLVSAQDNNTTSQLLVEDLEAAIALLENAITPKSKGGSYAANNATAIRKLIENALVLLKKK